MDKIIVFQFFLMSIIVVHSLLSPRCSRSIKDLEDINFDIEMAKYSVSEREFRSERLFRNSENDLSRYYQLNLSQNKNLLYVGFFCIIASFTLIGITFSILTHNIPGLKFEQFDDWTKGFIAALGAVGAIATNVVAAIYLQMHGKASDSLGEFHSRLVQTHQMFLGNVFASRVDDPDARAKLMGELAKSIISLK